MLWPRFPASIATAIIIEMSTDARTEILLEQSAQLNESTTGPCSRTLQRYKMVNCGFDSQVVSCEL